MDPARPDLDPNATASRCFHDPLPRTARSPSIIRSVIPASSTATAGTPPAEVVREQLALYLGAFTSRNAVQMMAKQCGAGTAPESLTHAQIPALLEALGPMLRTLLGRAGAEKVLGEIQWKLGL
jgi:hypothetical protein